MIRSIAKHSLEKEKSALLWFIWQNDFLTRVFALKMDNFVLKAKLNKICKLNDLKN